MQKANKGNKQGLIARVYVMAAGVFFILLLSAAYVLWINISDTKASIDRLNKDGIYSLQKSFDEVRVNIILQAQLAQVNGGRIVKRELGSRIFKSLYLINSSGALLDRFEIAGAAGLSSFDLPFLSELKNRDFVVSDFAFDSEGNGRFYVGYRINSQFYMVGELGLEYLKDKFKDEFGYLIDMSYIADRNGKMVAGVYPKQLFEIPGFSLLFSKGELLKPEVMMDYAKSYGYIVRYEKTYSLYVATFLLESEKIRSQALFSALIGMCLISFIVFVGTNIHYLKSNLLKPIKEISNFLRSDGASGLDFDSRFDELNQIKKGMLGLDKLVKKSGDILKDYQERYGYILEHSPINIIIYDAYSGQIVEVSHSAMRLYGYNREEFVKLNIMDMTDERMCDLLFVRQRSLQDGASYVIKHYAKDGHIIDVKINLSETSLSDGRRIKFMIIKDISKKLLKKKNLEIINEYSHLLSSVIAVANKDEPFILKNSTRNIAHIFGINHALLLEKGYDIRELVAPSDRNSFVNEIEMKRRLFAQASVSKDSFRLSLKMLLKGSPQPFRLSLYFVRDKLGNFTDIIYVMSDFSEQQNELSRRDAEIRAYKNSLWASEAISFEWDASSDILSTDDAYANMLGYESIKELGVLKFERIKSLILVNKDYKDSKEFLESTKSDNDSFIADIPSYKKDGSVVVVRMRARASQVGADGSVLKINGTFTDMSAKNTQLMYKDVLASLFSYADVGIVIMDLAGNIIDVNDSFALYMGFDPAQLVGQNISLIRSGLHTPEFYKTIWDTLAKDGLWHSKIWSRKKDGEDVLQHITINTIYDYNSKASFCVAVYKNLGESGLNQDYLEHIAYHDPLTKLPNRFLFTQKLENNISEMNDASKGLAVIYIDVDGFKNINDSFGHRVGDKFLFDLAQRLTVVLNDKEILARFGADEFGAIVGFKNRGELDEKVSNILKVASMPLEIDEHKINLSASIGVSIFAPKLEASDLLEQADWAMYQAKLAGKNRSYFFNEKRDKNFKRQYDESARVLKALKGGEFFVQYQPTVDVITNKIYSFEALIRWRDGDKVSYPHEFLPFIKNQSILDDITLFVLESAIKDRATLTKSDPSVRLSVNVSAEQLLRDDFFNKFYKQVVQSAQGSLEFLDIEIVGINMLLSHPSDQLDRYRAFGLSFVLDDFASGSSSLDALANLPVNKIKLASSFVNNFLNSKDSLLAIKVIQHIKEIYEIDVLVKGIEDSLSLKMLCAMGFELFQGFLISQPMFAQNLADFKFAGIDGLDVSFLFDDESFALASNIIHAREIIIAAQKAHSAKEWGELLSQAQSLEHIDIIKQDMLEILQNKSQAGLKELDAQLLELLKELLDEEQTQKRMVYEKS